MPQQQAGANTAAAAAVQHCTPTATSNALPSIFKSILQQQQQQQGRLRRRQQQQPGAAYVPLFRLHETLPWGNTGKVYEWSTEGQKIRTFTEEMAERLQVQGTKMYRCGIWSGGVPVM
jgi:hypothetical protein